MGWDFGERSVHHIGGSWRVTIPSIWATKFCLKKGTRLKVTTDHKDRLILEVANGDAPPK